MVAFVAPQGAPDTAPSAHGTLISVRFVQPLNAPDVMVVGVLLKVMEVRLVQLANAYLPMLVKPSGRDVRARLVQ